MKQTKHQSSPLKSKPPSILKFNIATALKSKFMLILIALLLATAAISTTKITNDINIVVEEDCTTTYWDEKVNTYETCDGTDYQTVCTDPPVNKSCTIEETVYYYKCKTGEEIIKNARTECKAKEFNIEVDKDSKIKKYNLDFSDWGPCIYEEENDCLIITCVSKYDGAHRGEFKGCPYGTTCKQFRICKDGIKTYYKHNSNEFKETDNAPILKKLVLEEVS